MDQRWKIDWQCRKVDKKYVMARIHGDLTKCVGQISGRLCIKVYCKNLKRGDLAVGTTYFKGGTPVEHHFAPLQKTYSCSYYHGAETVIIV